jgi:hypothetical protein
VTDDGSDDIERPPRRRAVRVAIVGAGVVLVAAGISVGVVRGGSGGAGAGGAPVSAQQPNANGGDAGAASNGAGAGGKTGAAAAPPSGNSGHNGPTATPATPRPTIAPTPGNAISGTADWQTSNCGAGWAEAEPCQVYYHGNYFITGVSGAKLIVTATADGTTLATQTFAAASGGQRWGDQMKFLAPKGNEIDFQAVIQDESGKVVTQTTVYKMFNH